MMPPDTLKHPSSSCILHGLSLSHYWECTNAGLGRRQYAAAYISGIQSCFTLYIQVNFLLLKKTPRSKPAFVAHPHTFPYQRNKEPGCEEATSQCSDFYSSPGDASEHFSQHVKLCYVFPVKWADRNTVKHLNFASTLFSRKFADPRNSSARENLTGDLSFPKLFTESKSDNYKRYYIRNKLVTPKFVGNFQAHWYLSFTL